jgi:DNA polymerase III epsilon subunit-like protein
MNLPPLHFTVLDTETTGLIHRTHRIIEFASIRFENGKKVDEYEELFSIDEDIPEVVQVLTRIKQNDIEGKKSLEEKKEEIMNHIGDDTIIIGQNVSFDIAMLKGEGIDLSSRPWIDTSMIASLVFPELKSYSLGYMSQVLDLNHEPVHRALGDVHATIELLERCWERLQEIPEDLLQITQGIMAKSSPAYRQFFEALPATSKKEKPNWLIKKDVQKKEEVKIQDISVPKPEIGTVDVIEEPLGRHFLESLAHSCAKDTDTVHWIAVKNLEATVRRISIPKGARILYPPFLLPDNSAVQPFAEQETFTSDESSLATKLIMYEPNSQTDIPIHGNERAIWGGKISCTDQSDLYQKQFEDLPGTLLLDHKQLLSFLQDPKHTAHGSLNEKSHIIIDDASMLEDTASHAYGAYIPLDDIRAASQGHDALTKFTDLLQIWIERVRAFQNIKHLTNDDLHSPESQGLIKQLETILADHSLPPQLVYLLTNLQTILKTENIKEKIIWIEQRQDGAQFLHSAPKRIDTILDEHLFKKFPTTLLIPKKGEKNMVEVIPKGTSHSSKNIKYTCASPRIFFKTEEKIQSILSDPPKGKTIILMPSRRLIEQCFVDFTEEIEQKGVTLFCQGLCGGQGRMQAEFDAVQGPAILLMTAWRYEIIELSPETVDQLFISNLPFDAPSYPVFEERSGHYKNSFIEYSLPRLYNRLFRILRTFMRHSTKEGVVKIVDDRIDKKEYGKFVRKYLLALSHTTGSGSGSGSGQMQMF